LVIIPLIGMVLLVTSRAISSDQQRTNSEIIDAQARQFLLAADSAIRRQLADAAIGQSQIKVPLPDGVEGCSISVSLHRQSDIAHAIMRVEIGNTQIEQTVRYVQQDGRWQADSIDAIHRRS